MTHTFREDSTPIEHQRRMWPRVVVTLIVFAIGAFLWSRLWKTAGANRVESNATRPLGVNFVYKVVNSSGQPVVDAKVTIMRIFGNTDRSNRSHFGLSHKYFPPDATLFPTVTTDAEGVARIEIPDETAVDNAGYSADRTSRVRETLRHPHLSFELQIDHPDYPRWEASTWEALGSVRPTDPIVLPDGTDIVVRAHREGDSELARRLYPSLRFWNEAAFTEVDGVLTVKHVDLSTKNAQRLMRIVQVPADGPAWFSDIIDLPRQPTRPQISLDVQLKPGVRLEGRLADDVPRPIKNGRVVASIIAGEIATGWNWVAAAEIADDGTFVFESLPETEHAQLVALCDGWVSRSPSFEDVMAYCRRHKFAMSDYEKTMSRVGVVIPQLVCLNEPVKQKFVPMGRSSVAEVRVVDESDNPIQDAAVRFWPNELGFNGGGSLVGWGFDQLSVIRDQVASGQPPADDDPWTNWVRDRYSGKTNPEGFAIIHELPAGASGKEAAIEYRFSVEHDNYVLDAPAQVNQGDVRAATIQVIPGQKRTTLVRMKRR